MPRKRKPKGRKARKKRVKTKEAKVARLKARLIQMRKPRIAPLHGSFLVTALIGLIITILFVMQRSVSWGITLLIFFAIMIIAALISMTKAPLKE